MKKTSTYICRVILGGVLLGVVLWLVGCIRQPGETEAEGHRRHIRNAKLNQQELMRDVDRFLLFDRPNRTTDRRMPPTISEQ